MRLVNSRTVSCRTCDFAQLYILIKCVIKTFSLIITLLPHVT